MYGEGISKMGDVIDLGTQMEIITKRGAFFSFNETRLGQGRENVKHFLKAHPELAEQIESAIRQQSGPAKAGAPGGADEEADE